MPACCAPQPSPSGSPDPQVTQLNWRLAEGAGEAIYCLGVEDNGHTRGLEEGELQASLRVLRSMAAEVGASAEVLRVSPGMRGGGLSAGEGLWRGTVQGARDAECRPPRVGSTGSPMPDDRFRACSWNGLRHPASQSRKRCCVAPVPLQTPPGSAEGRRCAVVRVSRPRGAAPAAVDLRVAVAGGVDSGKSTLVGVLSHGAGGAPALDNGRGSSRMQVRCGPVRTDPRAMPQRDAAAHAQVVKA